MKLIPTIKLSLFITFSTFSISLCMKPEEDCQIAHSHIITIKNNLDIPISVTEHYNMGGFNNFIQRKTKIIESHIAVLTHQALPGNCVIELGGDRKLTFYIPCLLAVLGNGITIQKLKGINHAELLGLADCLDQPRKAIQHNCDGITQVSSLKDLAIQEVLNGNYLKLVIIGNNNRKITLSCRDLV